MTDIELYEEPDHALGAYDHVEAAWTKQMGVVSIVDWCYLTEGQRQLYVTLVEARRRVPDLACRRGP